MFRMIPIFGFRLRKLLVYSHASVTKCPDRPTRIFPPISFRIPPTEIVGSRSAHRRMQEIMEVTVVFPCVPEIATESS